MIRTEFFDPPAWNRREIMRYARIGGADDSYHSLIDECIREARPVLSYRVCYTILPVSREEGKLFLGQLDASYQTIGKAIKTADQVLLFAATVGAPFDRLIRRYSQLSPSKALMMQAIGAERVESLCDAFCLKMESELNKEQKWLTPRVSPGYGDIPLQMQKDVFALLDCPRKIGLTLDESLMMSPSKSVTAIAGIVGECTQSNHKCDGCDQLDCDYRS